ncbi:carboxylesterase family protein [Altererythrobacter soli]|uniref:Carboxylesterase family protein n=1 Tax=Croceibacterium soli TaxID=1739690 RepID=A0A6I4UZ11_9SPHN|nr:carboxylesterase family protein [Croceibacterium soli]MXP42477.1 carboxylesterase family protein [Croceibacterium soli]
MTVLAAPAAAEIKQAATTGGTVEGESANGLSMFKGIPFAAPPAGANRWRAPQPVIPWVGVRRTVEFGPACMQGETLARQMGSTAPLSEDCLYIDVWTPAGAATDKLPVIAWIHGGGFNSGMSSVPLYDGANLARQGIVFVSINYRLGPFGFLATPELSAEGGQGSGNYGLLDQIRGLEWVRDNVANFGGDPTNVTMMGHSAGGQAVSNLAASPLARGLFHKVIAESGSSFQPVQTSAPWGGAIIAALPFAEAGGKAWLERLGVRTLAEARAFPAAALDEAQRAQGSPRFAPVADGNLIPGDHYELWKSKKFNDVPVLLGANSFEAPSRTHITPAAFEQMVRTNYGDRAEAVLRAYPHATDAEAQRSTGMLNSDSTFLWPAYTWARLQSGNGKAPVFTYWFHRPTAQSPDGSAHGAEVALVFGNEDARRTAWTAEDRALSRQLQSYWINFAKTGNPNGAGLPLWPQFAAGRETVMQLGAEAKPIPLPGAQRLAALDEYFAWRRGM